MIEFKTGKMYFRYNANYEISYRLTILSRWKSDNKTMIRYIIEHYNKGYLTDCEDYNVEVGETPVCYDSHTEVLYIREFKTFISAQTRNTGYYVLRYKEYVHRLITDIDFMREEVDNMEKYAKEHSVFLLLIGKVLECLDESIETTILNKDITDSVMMLLVVANELMKDIEVSDGIHFEKTKVFLTCPTVTSELSQIDKFIIVDTLYRFLAELISEDTCKIIDNLIHTYLTLT